MVPVCSVNCLVWCYFPLNFIQCVYTVPYPASVQQHCMPHPAWCSVACATTLVQCRPYFTNFCLIFSCNLRQPTVPLTFIVKSYLYWTSHGMSTELHIQLRCEQTDTPTRVLDWWVHVSLQVLRSRNQKHLYHLMARVLHLSLAKTGVGHMFAFRRWNLIITSAVLCF